MILAILAVPLSGFHLAQGVDYYVHPNIGSDDNPGTKESPWKTVGHALSLTESPVTAGDTVFLRGGDYYEIGVWLDKSGSEGKPIVIRNFPGETPVIYGTDPVYEKVPNKEWELVDKARNIYKTVKEWDGYPFGSMYRTGSPAKWYVMIPYWDNPTTPANENEWMHSDNEYYSDTPTGGYYAGPGFYWNPNDKKVYIRLSHPKPDTSDRPMGLTHGLNPNEVPLLMTRAQSGISVNWLNFRNANYIDVSGLKFVGLGSPLNYPGAAFHVWIGSHLNFKDITVDSGYAAFVMRKASHVVIDNMFKDGHLPPYLAWNDTKSGCCVSAFLGGSDGIAMPGGCTYIEIKNSTIASCFDGIRTNSTPINPSHDIKIHHNEFKDIRDDSISMGTGTWNVDISDNKFLNVSKSISRVGGDVHMDHPIGNIFIHHNLIEIGTLFQTRRRSNGEPASYINHIAFGTHSIGNANEGDTAQPWKLYNNTISTTGPIPGDNGMGHEYMGVRKEYANPNNLLEAHEVYNNIFILKGDWFFGRTSRVDSGQEVYDGNIYWKVTPGGKMPFATPVYNLAATPSTKIFPTLESLKADEWCEVTKSYYPPGWEHSGVEGDPQLGKDFYPVPGGLASTPGVDLSTKNWPDATRLRNRGALAPKNSP